MESSSPSTEGLGSPQDSNVPIMSDYHESSANIETAISSGEDIHLASHSKGGDARISNLETGLSSLQASLVNISPLLASRLGSSLGTETPQSSLPLSTPSCGRRACFRGSSYEVLPACDPSWLGSQSQSSSQPDFLSLPSFQTNDEDR